MTDSHAHSHPPAARLTRNEDLVLAALRGAATPQTAYQLLDSLRGDGIKAPLQIYRALRSLGDRHLVHRLESLNAFVACCHDHGTPGHSAVFAICENCGGVDEFTDTALDERLTALAGGKGFAVQHASVEIRGLCRACAEAIASGHAAEAASPVR